MNAFMKPMPIYTDMRWPAKTGIGNVMSALCNSCPADEFKVIDLAVTGSIGSPLSPIRTARQLSNTDIDGIFWNPGFIPPAWASMPTVVTVHDLTHLHYYSKLHSLYYNTVFKPLYRRCDAIICVSEFTRNEFLEWSGISPDRVSVVYNGVSPVFSENTEIYALPFEYVLYPGNHRGYKNLDRLIAAYAVSKLAAEGIKLVLTGTENAALQQIAQQHGVLDQLVFTGRVPDAEIPKLYRGARAIAFVSLYEGFGLPLIEAMASGVPVLTAKVSALPEVAANAALIVDPLSIDAIAEGLQRLCHDNTLRSQLISAGHKRAATFNWKDSSSIFWQIIRNLANK